MALTTCSESYLRCITEATNYVSIFILSLWFVVNWHTELKGPFSNAPVEKWIFPANVSEYITNKLRNKKHLPIARKKLQLVSAIPH
jgi:hypothetical protein